MYSEEEKHRRLADLRTRVIREQEIEKWREVWFFPERDGVKGWQGTQDIMFVGLNPSTGWFPSQADVFFYGELQQDEFGNAHLTDVVKCRATSREADEWCNSKNPKFSQDRLIEHLAYLEEEIQLIAPRLVVPMGGACKALLTAVAQCLPSLGHLLPTPLVLQEGCLPHYARLQRLREEQRECFREAFGKQMQLARRVYQGRAEVRE